MNLNHVVAVEVHQNWEDPSKCDPTCQYLHQNKYCNLWLGAASTDKRNPYCISHVLAWPFQYQRDVGIEARAKEVENG